jgi:SAM-dependent methyltransferase
MLPHSEACERNKGPILAVLAEILPSACSVLEIGSGTGQHAVHFTRSLRGVTWQPTDVPELLPGLAMRVEQEGGPNLRPPLALDVRQPRWPVDAADAVYTANTFHIMSWPEVESTLRGLARLLPAGGLFIVYGPFRHAGRRTAPSNEEFDRALRARDPASGIRDFEDVDRLLGELGLELQRDYDMPANNRLISWRRRGA